jgi:hypothetical protein
MILQEKNVTVHPKEIALLYRFDKSDNGSIARCSRFEINT